MNLLAGLIVDQKGQGIVEYTLMIGLVVLIIWTAVNATGVGDFLSERWDSVESIVAAGPS
jgi:Flp pilus assembly pilin Flp